MSASPKSIVEKAEVLLNKDDNRNKVASFLHTFSKCEVFTRPVLQRYYKTIGEVINADDIVLDSREILTAFSEEGIYFSDKKIITRIFGAEKAKGISSCKWLRNKISHELMARSIAEVCERYDMLIADMSEFIATIVEQR